MIPRTERLADWKRAQVLAKELAGIRRDPVQWLQPEPGPHAEECRRLTDEILQLGQKYGVGRDVAQAHTLQEFMVGILQAIDNLDPTVPS